MRARSRDGSARTAATSCSSGSCAGGAVAGAAADSGTQPREPLEPPASHEAGVAGDVDDDPPEPGLDRPARWVEAAEPADRLDEGGVRKVFSVRPVAGDQGRVPVDAIRVK